MPDTGSYKEVRDSLKELIEQWLEDSDGKRACVGYVGENTASHMADAAFAVLMGMADLERYLQKNNGLDTLPIE